MVSVTANIIPPAQAAKPRKLFAFGFVKMKIGGANSSPAHSQPDELNVLGLLIVDEPVETDETNKLEIL